MIFFRRTLLASLLTLGLLAACTSLDLLPNATPLPPEPTGTATAPAPTSIPTSVTSAPVVLRVWMPPRFNPASDAKLQARFDSFFASHPGVQLDLRIKEETEATGALQSLLLASAAAPATLPDLVLLSRPDLERAALAGVIQPAEGLSEVFEAPGWTPSARAVGRVQTAGYGLPFALDALVLASSGREDVASWADVVHSGPLTFNAHDVRFPLALYLAAGGTLVNDQDQPYLDEAILTRVLTLFAQKTLVPAEADDLVWQSLGQQGGGYAVGWATSLLGRDRSGVRVDALPGLEESPATLVTGWVWAVASLDAERQNLAVALAKWLTAEDFIVPWTESNGWLSPRNNAEWETVLDSARILPSNDAVAVITPLLEQAVTNVLQGTSPEAAAHAAVEQLK